MKRMSIIGLCLMATMILSAIAVASAYASEEGALLEGGGEEGTTVPLTVLSLLPLEPTLRGSIGTSTVNVLCRMTKGSGEGVFQTVAVQKIFVSYTECKLEGTAQQCTTVGSPLGVILTKELTGRSKWLNIAHSRSGLLLAPASGKVITEFTCESVILGKVIIENAVIGELFPIKLGIAINTGELVFLENATKNGQEWSRALNGPICELTVDSGVGRAWVMDRLKVDYGAPVEWK